MCSFIEHVWAAGGGVSHPIFFMPIFASGGISCASLSSAPLTAAGTKKAFRARAGTISFGFLDPSWMASLLSDYGKSRLTDRCKLCLEVYSFFWSSQLLGLAAGTFPSITLVAPDLFPGHPSTIFPVVALPAAMPVT